MNFMKKFENFKDHPVTRESLERIKPKKTFWSVLGVFVFFLLPEIVALFWGADIKAYTSSHLMQPLSLEEEYKYKAIELLFGEVSWLNLIAGVALLIWVFI